MNSNILVALDDIDRDEAVDLMQRLEGRVAGSKITDLLDAEGAEICRYLGDFGEVMADLKLRDIPRTMFNRARHYRNCTYLTVFADNTLEALEAALQGADECQVIGVTVLSSMDNEDVEQFCAENTAADMVLRLANHAVQCELPGIVCSPRELVDLASRRHSLRFITPGVRSPGTDPHDHKRVMTPAEAVRLGAHRIVVGQEIVQARDPVRAAERINKDVAAALAAA